MRDEAWAWTHSAGDRKWNDGVRKPASYVVLDDGFMSEGDFQSWGSIRMF